MIPGSLLPSTRLVALVCVLRVFLATLEEILVCINESACDEEPEKVFNSHPCHGRKGGAATVWVGMGKEGWPALQGGLLGTPITRANLGQACACFPVLEFWICREPLKMWFWVAQCFSTAVRSAWIAALAAEGIDGCAIQRQYRAGYLLYNC